MKREEDWCTVSGLVSKVNRESLSQNQPSKYTLYVSLEQTCLSAQFVLGVPYGNRGLGARTGSQGLWLIHIPYRAHSHEYHNPSCGFLIFRTFHTSELWLASLTPLIKHVDHSSPTLFLRTK